VQLILLDGVLFALYFKEYLILMGVEEQYKLALLYKP
jgi:hypothetical protein